MSTQEHPPAPSLCIGTPSSTDTLEQQNGNPEPGCESKTAPLTTRQSILPVFLVILLFCTWGFLGGIGEVMNKDLQQCLTISRAKSTGLQASFFAAYLVGPLTYSGWYLRKYGYRRSFILGLATLALGMLGLFFSGHYSKFAGFCGSLFIVGLALANLESAAFPYIASCGPPEWSELRLNLAQAIQSVFSVSALLFASYVILGHTAKDDDASKEASLNTVKWTYLGIAGFLPFVGIGFYFTSIPEITDADMEEQARMGEFGWQDKPFCKQYVLFWGTLAVFCWSGASTGTGSLWINFATEVNPSLSNTSAAHRLAIASGVMTFGRFVITAVMRVWNVPRLVLLGSLVLVILFLCLAIGVPGNAAIAMLIVEAFCKAGVHPTLVALSLRGLGRHTKRGGSCLIAASTGGIVFGPATGALADAIGTQKAYVIPLIGVLIALSFPIYLVCKAKIVDTHQGTGTTEDKRLEDQEELGRRETVSTIWSGNCNAVDVGGCSPTHPRPDKLGGKSEQ